MEFGGEILNESQEKNTKMTPEQIDALIAQGKTPDQFLASYEFDETQRDVIVFRLPSLRDVQVYDVVKTIDGFYGLVIAIQTYPYYNIMSNSYNFQPFSHNETSNDTIIPNQELSSINNLNSVGKGATCQIEVIRPYNTDSARDLKSVIDFVNSTSRKKVMLNGYRITDIVEIHKNLHHLTHFR